MRLTHKFSPLHLLLWHQVNWLTVLCVYFEKTSHNLLLLKNTQNTLVLGTESAISCAIECNQYETCEGFGYRNLPDKECVLINTTIEPKETVDQYHWVGSEFFAVEGLPSNCVEVEEQVSGPALLRLADGQYVVAYCEQALDGGGWLVFQRRFDGCVDFFSTWEEYKNGFGNYSGEFWLGNYFIHLLTANQDQALKIELECDGEIQYADYSTFYVDDEVEKYKLHVSGYSGQDPPGDSLQHTVLPHNGQNFSTWDRDNDIWQGNCAKDNNYGAWWYSNCHYSDLNGPYGYSSDGWGIVWVSWKGYFAFINATRMLIRPN